ncbi:hypothetical protein [Thermoleptolyngbya sp. C42_A2020_037]|uniref:hypothetical protein n=1 Tax=Thermoleptolyngbya sp. C42_A2020_037 TaxID=2747799 RepID=UPI0019E08B00|nr:hypothetical protein [Thermoleptolyngbya sp. C42_A2020_037]MBF2087010.1 hypothetical protein [Thermoleptolyngbya sp. C42_A2020_037]
MKKALHHISIFSELVDKYGKFLDENLVELSIFRDEKDRVFILSISKSDELYNEDATYSAEVFGTDLNSSCKSLDELKDWFLNLEVETLLQTTSIFPGYYTPETIEGGYEMLALYSFESEYSDPELSRASVDGYFSQELQAKHDLVFEGTSEADMAEVNLIRDWSCTRSVELRHKTLHLTL